MQYAQLFCMLTPRQCYPHRDLHSHSTIPHLSFLKHEHISLFCMSSSCRVLCLIIIATLQLLWQLNPCVHHHWVLFWDSFTCLVVETLRLLYHSRAHPLCCSYRLQDSSIYQSPLSTVFIPLADSLSLFIFFGNHLEVSSSPLTKTISHFWQLHCEPITPCAFGTFHLSF